MRPLPTTSDVALTALLVGWAVLLPALFGSEMFPPTLATYAVGIGIVLPFAVRRAFPVLAGTVMIAGVALMAATQASVSGLGVGEATLALGAYTIEAYRRRGPRLPVVAPAVAGAVYAVASRLDEVGWLHQLGPSTFVWLGGLALAGTAAGAAFRDRSAAVEAQREEVAALRRAAPGVAEARADVRRRALAADVEAVVHRLVRDIGPVTHAAQSGARDRVDVALATVGALAREALDELRAMLRALRSEALASSLAPARSRAEVDADAERLIRRPAGRPRPGPERATVARWLPVVLLLAIGVAERLVLPPFPVPVAPEITLPAPALGEVGAYLLVALSALVFALHARAPVALAAGVGVLVAIRGAEGSLTGLQPTRDLLPAAAAFFVALHGARAWVVAVPVAGWVVGRGYDPKGLGVQEAVTFGVLVVAAFVAGRVLREPLGRIDGIERERAALEREEAELAVRNESRERERVARELHDIVGHGLTLLAVQAGGARARLAAGHDVEEEEIADLGRALDDTLVELDRLRAVLGAEPRGAPTDPGWLDALVARASAGGARVEPAIDVDVEALAPGVAIVLRRVIEEAVTNALRHGDRGTIRLALRTADGEIVATVENTVGQANELSAGGSGTGLQGMAERLDLYGGRLAVVPGPEWWHVEAVLPHAIVRPSRDVRGTRPVGRAGA